MWGGDGEIDEAGVWRSSCMSSGVGVKGGERRCGGGGDGWEFRGRG